MRTTSCKSENQRRFSYLADPTSAENDVLYKVRDEIELQAADPKTRNLKSFTPREEVNTAFFNPYQ